MPDSPSGRPEDLRFISGVILVSSQPWRLTAFYRDVLGLPLAEERHGEAQPHWGCELGDVHFAIHPVADYPEDPAGGPGPVKLAFMVFDLSRVVEWLDRRGIPLCYPPADLGEESRITAVRDPDGNLVELTQLGPGWLGHLKAQRADGNDLVSAWGARLAQLAEHFPKLIRTRTALLLARRDRRIRRLIVAALGCGQSDLRGTNVLGRGIPQGSKVRRATQA